MDIENVWRESNNGDDELNRLLSTGDFRKIQSKLPLKKLRLNLLIGIVWAILITLSYIVLFFFFSIWQVHVALVVVIVFNVVIMWQSWKLYLKTPSSISPSNSLKQELTAHYNSYQRWWQVQQKVSLFVYPIAATGGFILGGYVGSGKPVEEFLYNSKMLILLGITLVILVPLCHFFARWMFKYAYGKHLKKLQATIDELN